MRFRAKADPHDISPERGDIIHTNFSPSAGTEMAFKHYALVLSHSALQKRTGRAIVCPLSSKRHENLAEIPIPAMPPALPKPGVILADQIRTIDLRTRESSIVAKAPPEVLQLVMDTLWALLEDDM